MNQDPRRQLMENFGKAMVDSVHEFSPVEYDRTSRRFHKVYGPHCVFNPEDRILDVGCGDGHFLYYLKSLGCSQLEGIDSSEDRLERCRQHVVSTVYKADAFEWLQSKKGSYDWVVCNHMVEHFEDPKLYDLVGKLVDALAPGGKLLITTPNACTPWAGYNQYSDLTHVRLFTAESLTQLLSAFQLQVCCHPEAVVPYDFPTTLRWTLWKVWEVCLKLDFRIQIGGTRNRSKTPFLVSPNLFAVGRKA